MFIDPSRTPTVDDEPRRKLDGVIEQLCGELLLRTPPTAQPPIMAGVRIGLELFDLLLNPDHVVRATENLYLKNAVTLGRNVEIDVSLDRLSGPQEEGATQLATFMSERLGNGRRSNGDRPPGEDRGPLWMPLLTVPRPFVPPIDVVDDDERVLPRPRQRDVRRPLEAALYHLFRNAVLEHPEFEEPDAPLTRLIRHDHPGRWLLQAALLDIGEAGRNSPRSAARSEELRERLRATTDDDPAGEGASMLRALVASEEDSHRRTALEAVEEVIVGNRPLLELIDLVHSGYVVVAGIDRTRRHQRLTCTMPDVDAGPSSAVRSFWAHNWRTFDPREHNFTIRVDVPVPTNLRQYRLQLAAAAPPSTPALNVSLIPALHFDRHPAETALRTAEKCVKMLGEPPDAEDGSTAGKDDRGTSDRRDPRVNYLVGEAVAALGSLRSLTEDREQAAAELGPERNSTASGAVGRAVSRLTATTAEARRHIDDAMEALDSLTPTKTPADVTRVQSALEKTREVFAASVMRMRLVTPEMPGTEVGRVHINQPDPPARPDARPRSVEVWATFVDDSHPYARSALVPPLAVAGLLYLIGAFLLNDPLWWLPFQVDTEEVAASMGATHPGPVVSLLLLIPAFALSRLQWTDRRDVAGRIRRPARLLVAGSVVTLCLAAVVLATQLSPASPTASDVWWVIGTLDVALLILVAWIVWSSVACLQRGRCLWRPKGVSRLFDPAAGSRSGTRTPTWWTRSRRHLSYYHRSPDALFDLRQPARSFTPPPEGI